MLRALLVSFLISLLSLILVFFFPIDVTIQGKSSLSPYFLKIIELQEKTALGLPADAPEWNQLEILKHKDRMWIDGKNIRKSPVGHLIEYMIVKSSKLSLMLFSIWLVSFYYFFRKAVSAKHLLVLTFPAAFLLLNKLMLIPFAFIAVGVITAFSLMKWKNAFSGKDHH